MRNIISFYKPLTQGVSAMLNYQNIILTKGDDATGLALKQGGFTQGIPMYMRGDAIQQTPDKTYQPMQNQAAYNAGDWQDIDKNHKDWFLLGSKGERIPALVNAQGQPLPIGTPYWMMDPGNTGWQKFWTDRHYAAEIATPFKYSGGFMDNTEASLAKRQLVGIIPAKYPTDATYAAAWKSFIIAAKTKVNPLWNNIVNARSQAGFDYYLTVSDGCMDESWGVDWHGYYTDTKKWEADLNLVIAHPDKTIICVSQGDQTDNAKQLFAFASYLLVVNPNANFRYTNASGHYTDNWWYADYDNKLGNPNPANPNMFRSGNICFRLFENGYVQVDPAAHVAKIIVGA